MECRKVMFSLMSVRSKWGPHATTADLFTLGHPVDSNKHGEPAAPDPHWICVNFFFTLWTLGQSASGPLAFDWKTILAHYCHQKCHAHFWTTNLTGTWMTYLKAGIPNSHWNKNCIEVFKSLLPDHFNNGQFCMQLGRRMHEVLN